MKRSKSSQNWLRRHFDDHYVKEAQKAGYRSRAVFKLLEIQQKDRILKPGMVVVDLGAAPGGWSQIAAPIVVGKSGAVIAMDILDIDPLDNVTFIKGDFTDQDVHDSLLVTLNGREVDLVMCSDEGALVFVEVKTRRSEQFAPAQAAVNYKKRKKMASTARSFVNQYKLKGRLMRFDVMAVVLGEKGAAEVRHYKNAFTL